MFLNIVLLFVMWVVGIFLFSFGGGQIFITLRCAVPMTKALTAVVPADKRTLWLRMILTVLLWIAISAAVIWAVMYFGNSFARYGFWGGFLLAALMGFGKMGMNATNIEEYFRSFGRHYDQDELAIFLAMSNWNKTQEE